jgi:hypothetical protein
MGALRWAENRTRIDAIPSIDMNAPTTSSLRSSERVSHQLSETGSGVRDAGCEVFPFPAPAFGAAMLRAGDFPDAFARGFDFLDEVECGVLSGITAYSSIAQMVCFSF